LKLMPFKSLGVVSYSPSIVTMTVSAVILEIFSVKEYPDLENTATVVYSHCIDRFEHHTVAVFSLGGATAR